MVDTTRLSLRTKLMTVVALIVLLGFVVTVSVLSLQARQMQQTSAMAYAKELSGREAASVETALNEAMDTARVVASALQSLKTHALADRATANVILKGVLESNPALLGVWTGWEPDAFDGKDAEYVGQAGHDATGRFVPYWNRGSGTAQLEPLLDYDKPGVGDFYQLPKHTGKEVLVEPYKYSVGGKEMLITSLVVPITQDGRFLGVAGVDISLSSLQETISKIRVMETGRASLLSNKGVYVGDADEKKVGMTIPQEAPYDQALKAVQSGQSIQLNTRSEDLGEITQVYVPVHVGDAATPWSFVAEVQDTKVFEAIQRMTWTAVALCLASVLVVSAVLSVALNRMVLQPIGGDPKVAADMADRVAQGDLSQSIHVAAGDTSSLMAQLKRMQDSLASVVANVRQGAQNVALASAEISQGNHDLSSRTESQASAIEETAASMEELGSTVRQNADSAQQANQYAQNASAVAQRGGEVMGRVVDTMKDISASSQRIADIIGVINGIAFQTNILALNAAVEAARAGEQGRGFAVVASEVRSLAQRSAEAAKEIKTLIDTSVERVNAGSQLVDQAGATMEQVVQAIQSVSEVMAGISAASREQSAGVGQISEAVSDMDQTTQQNAALVEEMAAAATALKNQADELVQTVAVFRLQNTTQQHLLAQA